MTMRSVAALLLACAVGPAAERVEFNRDVRPIRSENCFACHGPDRNARQADVRLDRREYAMARGVLGPGDTSASRLVQRIHQENLALVRPPVATDKKLTSEQKEILSEWIAQGAEYQLYGSIHGGGNRNIRRPSFSFPGSHWLRGNLLDRRCGWTQHGIPGFATLRALLRSG